jgi:hypothetical protein
MDDRELVFENTPLENLRTILSEADASAQAVIPGKEEIGRPGSLIRAGVNKEDLKKVVERLETEAQQFLSRSDIGRIVAPVTRQSGSQETGQSIFYNQYVVLLDQLINNKI